MADWILQVTEKPEYYYPTYRRMGWYFVSFVVTSILLLVTFVIMICSLNLQVRATARNDLAQQLPCC